MSLSPANCLRQIFRWMNQAKITYAVLGNVNQLPSDADGDIDLIVSPASLLTLPERLRGMCRELGIQWVLCIQYQARAFAILLAWEYEKRHVFLKIDICSEYIWQGRRFDGEGFLLAARELCRKGGDCQFYVPHPEAAFAYYLWKKSTKGSLSACAFAYLRQVSAKLDDRQIASKIKQLWPSVRAESMAEALRNDHYDVFCQQLTVLPRNHFPWKGRFHPIAEIRRLMRRFIYPVGLSVQLLGPDGCGKSSVIERLYETFSHAVPRVLVGHFRPQWGRGIHAPTGNASAPPHGKRPRSPIGSLLKAVYYALDNVIGYWLFIRPHLVKNAVYLSDRGYADMLIDPIRYRMVCPAGILRVVGWIVPRPDLTIVLDAPPEQLLKRKQEVDPDVLKQLCAGYQQYGRSASGCLINAGRSLETVCLEVETMVISAMRKRTEQYWMDFRRLLPNRLNTSHVRSAK